MERNPEYRQRQITPTVRRMVFILNSDLQTIAPSAYIRELLRIANNPIEQAYVRNSCRMNARSALMKGILRTPKCDERKAVVVYTPQGRQEIVPTL